MHCYTQQILLVSDEIYLCKFMRANHPQDGAISDPSGMIRRIYVQLHITMLHTKYRSFDYSGYSCGCKEEGFYMYFPL